MDRLAPYEYEGYSYQYAVPYPTPCTSVYEYSDVPAYGSLDAPESASGDFIPTEPLKILVTSISQRASPEETIAWIRRKTGRYVAEIIHIDVPSQNHKKNRVRGHAYVIFKSTAAAHGAVQLLHQAVFQNRKISARFTIEGVTAGEQASPTAPGQGERDRERDGVKGSKEICEARATDSKTRAGSKPRPKGSEGTNCCGQAGREKQDRTEAMSKSTEKENKVYHVIADGSSRRLLDRKKGAV
ncbi:hypothetical protein ESCO_000730 [Escovopsis weberi]|uniref:RRM domain-containing protein n=1 Tax=Escovopsis weberi TaxID=150374 RepID=A0A0N0RT76_ESCWE|nr:hypothetical protein ESCO_000730 [Escovopsis weberi]